MTDRNLEYDYASKQRVLKEEHYGVAGGNFPIESWQRGVLSQPYILSPLDYGAYLPEAEAGEETDFPLHTVSSDFPFLWHAQNQMTLLYHEDLSAYVIKGLGEENNSLFANPLNPSIPQVLYPGFAFKVIYYDDLGDALTLSFCPTMFTEGYIDFTVEGDTLVWESQITYGNTNDGLIAEVDDFDSNIDDSTEVCKCLKVWNDAENGLMKVKHWVHGEAEPSTWIASFDFPSVLSPYRWAYVFGDSEDAYLGQIKIWRYYDGVDIDSDFSYTLNP